MSTVFANITEEKQQRYEADALANGKDDRTPCICGYYGRACYQMGKVEGANRMICTDCPLARYAAKADRIAKLRNKHMHLVKVGEFETARCLLYLLRKGTFKVGLGEYAGFEAECLAEECGCRVTYSRNYMIATIHI